MVGRRHITEDLLVDVLLRLPVESLLRFKCVCKHWYALITSPSFIEKHFRHEHNHARLLIGNLTISYDSSSVAFSLFPDKIVPGVSPEQKIVCQLHRVTDFKSIAGPVEGLFLVEIKKEYFDEDNVQVALWNPATRGFWPLPPVSFERQPSKGHENQFALGFDPLTRDYKVVCIQFFWDDWILGVPRCFVGVYSLRINSWKNVTPEFPHCTSLHESSDATYLNGLCYWLSGRLDDIFCICSFDMGSEQFGSMQGPDINPKVLWGKLMLRGDSLAMLVGDPGKRMTSIYDVWVMNQEGDWTKVVTVQPRINASHWPRGTWEDDKMVFEVTETSQLVLYDPTTRQVADLGIQLNHCMSQCWIFNYKESLVPIKSGNDSQGNDNAVLQIDHFFNVLQ